MVQNRSARNTQDRNPTGQKEESWRRILGTTPDAVGRIHTSIWRLLIFKWWCQRLFKDFRKKCQSYWQKRPQRACFSWIFALREHGLYNNLSTVRRVEVNNRQVEDVLQDISCCCAMYAFPCDLRSELPRRWSQLHPHHQVAGAFYLQAPRFYHSKTVAFEPVERFGT